MLPCFIISDKNFLKMMTLLWPYRKCDEDLIAVALVVIVFLMKIESSVLTKIYSKS